MLVIALILGGFGLGAAYAWYMVVVAIRRAIRARSVAQVAACSGMVAVPAGWTLWVLLLVLTAPHAGHPDVLGPILFTYDRPIVALFIAGISAAVAFPAVAYLQRRGPAAEGAGWRPLVGLEAVVLGAAAVVVGAFFTSWFLRHVHPGRLPPSMDFMVRSAAVTRVWTEAWLILLAGAAVWALASHFRRRDAPE